MINIEEKKACRACGSQNLKPVLSLGDMYVVDFVEDGADEDKRAPLDLVLCNANDGGCGLVQLRHTFPPDSLYRQYWYKSGINGTIRRDLADIVAKAERLMEPHIKEGDITLDIGTNDGTMLRDYKNTNLITVGFEPAYNLIQEASVGTSKIINNFFNYKDFKNEFGSKKAKIITAISMFYDLDNPNEFLDDIVSTLDDKGIFIVQQNYLVNMLKNNAFDNICHEHLEYFSLLSMENLLRKHDLEVFDVELNSINGGSIRTYIKKKGCDIKPFEGAAERTERIRSNEKNLELQNSRPYDAFVSRVHEIKGKIYDFISQEVEKGKKVMVCGASTRGNTTLQYCGLDHTLLTAAVDMNPEKWGKKTIGTKIPIMGVDGYKTVGPDYVLVLPWHFFDEIHAKESRYLKPEAKFIVPMPEMKIVEPLHD